MKNEKPYEGLARVTEVVGQCFGGIKSGWIRHCKQKDPETEPTNEEEILDWASNFGTMMHEYCLEGKKGSRSELSTIAKSYYDEWLAEYLPIRIKVEKQVIHSENIYGGTVDMFCRINGERFIVDLKFFGFWKEHFGYIQSKEIFPSYKKAKANLQTNLYEATQKRKHKRACLVIHPNGFIFHEFKKDSKKLEEAMKIAEEMSKATDKYLLTNF